MPEAIYGAINLHGSTTEHKKYTTLVDMAGGGSSTAEFSPWQRTVGITLAILSCVFIGTSFILKKKGLLHTQHADNQHAYLKDKMWWAGMILSINF